MGERIQGMKEKVKGTIKRDPGLKQQGQERMTGELKRKQKEKVRPFSGGDALKVLTALFPSG